MSLPLLMGLGFALSALIAWRFSSSEFGIDVTKGLAWLFGLLALFGWSMYGYQRVARDVRYEQMWDIALGVTTMAKNQGLAADSAMHALQDLAKRTHPTIEDEPEDTAQHTTKAALLARRGS